MTIDPKALIERLFAEIEHGDEAHRAWLREALQNSPALRDLTAEVARLKALGDGLVGYTQHRWPCMKSPPSGGIPANECTCGLSAAFAAWEKKDG